MRQSDDRSEKWSDAPQEPMEWKSLLQGYSWERQTKGQSEAAVFCLERPNGPTLFIKTEPLTPQSELAGEAMRLRWLAENGVSCPQVLDEITEKGRHWLLMTGLPGHDLSSLHELTPSQIVEVAATSLRDLHALDTARCPFEQSLDHRLSLARMRVSAELIDESDFDEVNLGKTAVQLFEELLRNRPWREDLVVAHGDATLSNLIADGGRFSGFIDCGRLGVADRHQDLALMVRDVHHVLGPNWVVTFLRIYGYKVDQGRIQFYQLLDEFF